MEKNKELISILMEIRKVEKELNDLNDQRDSLKNKVEEEGSSPQYLLLTKYLEYKYKKLKKKSDKLVTRSRELNQANKTI